MDPSSQLHSAFDRYGDGLFRLCFVQLASRQDAEDAVQETFLRYLRRNPVFESPDHEKGWLIRVSINICRDLQRFRLRHPVVDLEELADVGVTDPDTNGVLVALLSLPAKIRLVLHLYYVEDMPAGEIARQLQLSLSAVKMRLQRGRQMLKIQLEEEHI